jgi:hypothetical protein
LRRILKVYASYYSEVRKHPSLNKDAPSCRISEPTAGRALSLAHQIRRTIAIEKSISNTNSDVKSAILREQRQGRIARTELSRESVLRRHTGANVAAQSAPIVRGRRSSNRLPK